MTAVLQCGRVHLHALPSACERVKPKLPVRIVVEIRVETSSRVHDFAPHERGESDDVSEEEPIGIEGRKAQDSLPFAEEPAEAIRIADSGIFDQSGTQG